MTCAVHLQYGICFDIDGVVARGLTPVPEAVEAFKMLCGVSSGKPRIPFAFVTNGFGSAHVKAQRLRQWLKCEVVQLDTRTVFFPLPSNSLPTLNCKSRKQKTKSLNLCFETEKKAQADFFKKISHR